tara:strand:- start:471 stop:1301 length:831 start_codon:yes stop_codon:yes gene_type:complete
MSFLWYPSPKEKPIASLLGMGGGIGSNLVSGSGPNPYRGLVGNGSLRSGFTGLQMAFPMTSSKNGSDLSGNNRDLSNHGPNNAVEYSISGTDKNGDPPPYTTAYGKTQSSMDYSWLNANTDFNFKSVSNMTIECWVQVNSPDTFMQLINTYSSQSEGTILSIGGSGVFSGAYTGYSVSGGTLVIGQWHHVAYTRDTSTSPDTHTVFLDGVQVGQVTSDSYGSGYSENQYGNGQYGGGGGVAGNPAPNSFMMDFRVFNTIRYTGNFDIAEYLPTLDA